VAGARTGAAAPLFPLAGAPAAGAVFVAPRPCFAAFTGRAAAFFTAAFAVRCFVAGVRAARFGARPVAGLRIAPFFAGLTARAACFVRAALTPAAAFFAGFFFAGADFRGAVLVVREFLRAAVFRCPLLADACPFFAAALPLPLRAVPVPVDDFRAVAFFFVAVPLRRAADFFAPPVFLGAAFALLAFFGCPADLALRAMFTSW
jgi:hypothetical protein